MNRLRICAFAVAIASLLGGGFTPVASALVISEVTVYTAIEPELLNAYATAFTAENPDVMIRWVRESTGPITARLIAEKDAPQADVVFGLALSSILVLEEHGLLEPYTSRGEGLVIDAMRDKRPEPVWSALCALGGAMCVNTKELERKQLPLPQTWADLAKPEYKGQVVMSNPASSAIALMNIDGWLYQNGEEPGWEFMNALDANVKMYVHSGCKPCQMAAMGEAVVGISSDSCARTLLERKAPLALVRPQEGIGWYIEAAALVKGSKNPGAAKRLIDFASSQAVGEIALNNHSIPAREDMQSAESKEILNRFLPLDAALTAKNRDATIASWRERFERR